MKTRPFAIVTRYDYRPDLIPEHGSPLFDRKHERTIKPNTTVRVGEQVPTPKQIVYILHHPHARGTDTEANPLITLPMYLTPKDGNPNNIRIENLRASDVSSRWNDSNRNPAHSTARVTAPDGSQIPKHLIAIMTPEELARFGLKPNNKPHER